MRRIAIVCAAALACAPVGPAWGQAFVASTLVGELAPSRVITVPKDKSVAFRLTGAAGEIVVAQPDIAEIVANTDRSVYVRGKTLGTTNILIYDPAHRLIEVIDVRVAQDIESLQTDLRNALPGEPIRVIPMAGGVLLSGQVSTSSVAARAKAIAERYAPAGVTSDLTVEAAQQVMLEVRIIEASRSSLKDFGINLDIQNNSGIVFGSGTGLIGLNAPQGTLTLSTNVGPTTIEATLRALEEKGVIRTLARPNLAAISGQEATFLAGGEFPYPVPTGQGDITIEFKPFGVNLKFTPVVQDGGLINLKVSPEVSQLDYRQSLRLSNVEVPSILVRRAATTIELKDGETFAIAGLFQQDYANTARQIPWAGDVPVLGSLFRSSRWKKQETELLILVTPRLVTASESRALAPDPFKGSIEPSAIDVILGGISLDRAMTPAGPSYPAPAPAPASTGS
ncbi:MAG: type II and III secretion system protein family protein [Caulobacter sp.]|nr:type II and III secretion system protein family protein [Caulobacter sp.]